MSRTPLLGPSLISKIRSTRFCGSSTTFGVTVTEIRPLLMQVERTYGRRWHFTSQVEIHLAGDRADVRSYNLSVASVPVSPVPPADLGMFYGWYVDRMEKREGRWGIAARKHLLLAGTSVREIALDGPMAVLNQVGEATPAHPDYLRG